VSFTEDTDKLKEIKMCEYICYAVQNTEQQHMLFNPREDSGNVRKTRKRQRNDAISVQPKKGLMTVQSLRKQWRIDCFRIGR